MTWDAFQATFGTILDQSGANFINNFASLGICFYIAFIKKYDFQLAHFVQLGAILATLDAFLVTFGATWVAFQQPETSKSDHVVR